MLGVSLATVATQCSVLLQYYITAAVSSVVILNSSLSSPGPGRGSRRHSEHVFTPFLTAALWLQSGSSSSQYSVFLMEAHLIFGLYTTAPPGSGQYDLMSGSYFCPTMVNTLNENYSKYRWFLPILTMVERESGVTSVLLRIFFLYRMRTQGCRESLHFMNFIELD